MPENTAICFLSFAGCSGNVQGHPAFQSAVLREEDVYKRQIITIQNQEVSGKFAEDKEYASLRMSEAMFNRAYSLYIMNTLYGDIYVPQEYTTALPKNYSFPRETSENIYKLIIGDLRFAYDHLPDVRDLNLRCV